MSENQAEIHETAEQGGGLKLLEASCEVHGNRSFKRKLLENYYIQCRAAFSIFNVHIVHLPLQPLENSLPPYFSPVAQLIMAHCLAPAGKVEAILESLWL